jgi:hypothetical protein
VGDYYNGGMGSLGSGPGKNFGISFNTNAQAYIPGKQSGMVTPFPNDPSPPTVLLLARPNPIAGAPTSFTMNVAGGFTQFLSYYYTNIAAAAATIQVYSGLDGGGMLLAQAQLPSTGQNPLFSGAELLPFGGTASSVVFSGGDNQLALDDIGGSNGPPSSPEPSSWILMVSCGVVCLIVLGPTRKPARSDIAACWRRKEAS